MDLVEMDAASNRGIDEIRKLRDRVGLAPMAGRYKVYLVDEVHMLTAEAYNALLKTLEEPPPHIIFVLATTESHKVPPTIVSRCQRFDFRRLPLAAVVSRLEYICRQEGIQLEEAALQEIARSASGSLRDAINLVEQLSTYYGSSPTLEQVRDSLGLTADARSRQFARHILEKDLSSGLKLIAGVRDDGIDMRQFQREVVDCLRYLLLVKAGVEDTLDLAAEEIGEMRSLAAAAASDDILRALRAFGQADFRDDPQSSLPLELALAEHALGPVVVRAAAEEAEPVVRALPAGRQARFPPGRPAPPQPSRLRARLQEPTSRAQAAGPGAGSEEVVGEAAEAVVAPGEGEGQSAPAAAGGDDLLYRLRLACKKADHRLAGWLNGTCEIQSLENGVLVLAFYPQFGLHRSKIEQPPGRRVVEEAASRLLGQSITVECTTSERERPGGRPPRQGGHLVQAAREMGARPVLGRKGGPSGDARNES